MDFSLSLKILIKLYKIKIIITISGNNSKDHSLTRIQFFI